MDLLDREGPERADVLVFSGGDADMWARVVVRPSGTEPKVKFYLEAGCPAGEDLRRARERAGALRDELVTSVQRW
jgi:phosphomannomutase